MMSQADEPISWLARAGYASRGVVYLIIGGLSGLAAVGAGRPEGARGAIQELLSQPFGSVLLALLLVGLVGYVLWRLVQAIKDTDHHGRSAKGVVIRAGLVVSAATYATLALYAASRIGLFSGGEGGEGGGTIARSIAAFVGSRTVAWILAAIFIGVGIAHVHKAVTAKFERYLMASDETMRWLRPVSTIGLIARGFVFFVLAFLLIYRGATASGEDGSPPGVKEALSFLQDLPFGEYLMALMGAGLILFAVYSFCEAVWRRVDPDLG